MKTVLFSMLFLDGKDEQGNYRFKRNNLYIYNMEVTIKIQTKEQAAEGLANGKSRLQIMEGINPEHAIEPIECTIGILESGTQEERTSLMFILKGENGFANVLEITARQFEVLIGAVRGATERFGK